MFMSKVLRVLILADINSPHTQKWVLGLSKNNIEIGIFSFNHSKQNWFANHPNVHCLRQSKKRQNNSWLSKLEYIFLLPQLLINIKRFKPNIVHAHYASSYGFLAALSFFKPMVVSVWGSDILQFPKKGLLQKLILNFVLLRAKKICATSSILQREVALYSDKPCEVIPFGIDLQNFYSFNEYKHPSVFTIGCIKNLERIYNIDKVIEAFSLLRLKYPYQKFHLKIIGEGTEEKKLRALTEQLNLSKLIEFTGKIEHEHIPEYLHQLNVLVNVSEYESFGVSVAEAMACKIPVIVSAHEGFKDLVPNDEYAIIVKIIDAQNVFKALEEYFINEEKREEIAGKSYHLIQKEFNWLNNLKQMQNVYTDMLPDLGKVRV